MSSIPELTWGNVFASVGVGMLVYLILDNPAIDQLYNSYFVKSNPIWRCLIIGLLVGLILTLSSLTLGNKLTSGERTLIFFSTFFIVTFLSYFRYTMSCDRKTNNLGVTVSTCKSVGSQWTTTIFMTIFFGFLIFLSLTFLKISK